MKPKYKTTELGKEKLCIHCNEYFPLETAFWVSKLVKLKSGALKRRFYSACKGCYQERYKCAEKRALKAKLKVKLMITLSQETLSQAMHWLVNGQTGMSSTCILATIINGGPIASDSWEATFHPHDPADFKRCVVLLDAVPEFRNRLQVMKSVSKHWASLVDHWDEIEQLLREEISNPVRPAMAPKTYDLMKCVLNGVAVKDQPNAK